MKRISSPLGRRGLTLIELVVVLAILVGLAGLIVPRLDFLKNQTDHAAAAATSADLAKMLQTQKTSSGAYPSLDLLIDESGAAYSKVWNVGSLPIKATTLTTTAGERWYGSLLEGGLKLGYQQVSTATNASSSTGTAAPVDLITAAAGGSLTVAEVDPASTQPYVGAIYRAVFPDTAGTPPAGVKLIAMGIGSRNGMVGNVMTSTPIEAQGDDPTQVYCRYIAIFAIYQNGTKPAQLKMVVDHRLKQIDKRIEQYGQTGPT
jgi:prepilin-type N-terminal cleavage/methylation domain-containing protein